MPAAFADGLFTQRLQLLVQVVQFGNQVAAAAEIEFHGIAAVKLLLEAIDGPQQLDFLDRLTELRQHAMCGERIDVNIDRCHA